MTTPRRTPSLVDLLVQTNDSGLLHYDGEFSTAEDLVVGTYTGRNFGWLPDEQAAARRLFAQVNDLGYADSKIMPH